MNRFPDPKVIDFFDVQAKVLIRCAVLGILLILLTAAIFVFARDPLYDLNSRFISLSKQELDLIVYGFIVVTKFVVLLFALIPWAAIRLVLRKSKAAP